MLKYCAKRIFLLIPLLIGLTFMVFIVVRIGGTNPAVLIAGPEASADQIEAIERELHLNEPILLQYWIYMKGLFQGDMGTSWVTGRPVTEEIRDRLPISLELYTISAVLAVLIGGSIGYVSALNANGWLDHGSRTGTLFGISMPKFWLALMLIYIFFYKLGWAPAPLGRIDIFADRPPHITGAYLIDSIITGQWETARSAAIHLVLPVMTIVIINGAAIAKQVRAIVWQVRRSDYVKYARACGQSRQYIWGLILRNSLPGIVTYSAIVYSLLLGMSAIVELIFSWGGLGYIGIRSVTSADFAVVQGYVLTAGIMTAIVYFCSDIIVAGIDPRVRLG
jgi:ABC-type dipeptide/oligopeptide/nickel transport system permease component